MSYSTYKNIKKTSITLKEWLKSFNLGSNKINYLIDNKLIFINGQMVYKRDYLLNENDEITIDTSIYDQNEYIGVRYPLNIIYEDDYIIAVDKPTSTIMYPEHFEKANTLANYLSYYYQKTNQERMIRHIYRLDEGTSGVVVYAKDILSHSFLDKQFESHNVKKEYYCVVYGIITKKGSINSPIGKDRHVNNKMVISQTGKEAVTSFEPVCHMNNQTLLKVSIKTGRTHQIRVHLSSIGHPLVGDKIYNATTTGSMVLFCYHIGFVHPITKEWVDLYAKKPESIEQFINEGTK